MNKPGIGGHRNRLEDISGDEISFANQPCKLTDGDTLADRRCHCIDHLRPFVTAEVFIFQKGYELV